MIHCEFCNNGRPKDGPCFHCDSLPEADILVAEIQVIHGNRIFDVPPDRTKHTFGKHARRKMLIHMRACMEVHFRDRGKM